MLDGRAVIADRDTTAPDSFFDSIRPLGWLRRAINANHDRALSGRRRGRAPPTARLSAFPWRG